MVVTDMNARVYFDNAATTPLLKEVIEVMHTIMQNDFGNPSSIHAHGRKAKTIIENARRVVAKAINASISEVFFTSSATESNNMILKNAVLQRGIKRIISTPIEHHCVLHSLDYIENNYNCEVIYLNVDSEGFIDLKQLDELLQNTDIPTLVSVMHGNNEIGTIQDIDKIGQLCAHYKALFHSDTVQTLGKIPLDVQSTHVHYISGSAHKLHGPKGVGFVYIQGDSMLSPFIHGGSQERNMRAGTENIIGIGGMAKAIELAIQNMENRKKHILFLKNSFMSLLKDKISDITFVGSLSEFSSLYHILNVSLPHSQRSDMLVMNLDIAGISVSSGSACTAGIEQESHVLQAINHAINRHSVRFSFSHLNTIQEVNYAANVLKEIS